VARVREIIRNNRRLTIEEVEEEATWIYGHGVETKRQSSPRDSANSPRSKKARHVRSNDHKSHVDHIFLISVGWFIANGHVEVELAVSVQKLPSHFFLGSRRNFARTRLFFSYDASETKFAARLKQHDYGETTRNKNEYFYLTRARQELLYPVLFEHTSYRITTMSESYAACVCVHENCVSRLLSPSI